MFPLPFDKYTITTKKSKEQVISKLQSHLSETSSSLNKYNYNHKLLKGKYSDGIFYVTTQFILQFYKSERQKNSPLSLEPYMKIRVQSNGSGSDVKVSARPQISFLVFMLIFVFADIFLTITYVDNYINTGIEQEWYIPILIFVFIIIFICLSFWFFEFRARKLLKEIIGV